PWEGASFLGTTDVDHDADIDKEPVMSRHEALYLMDGFKWAFPDIKLSIKDGISTIAGVRPVLSSGKRDPSQESREHVVWKDKGLVTVTGGKLTTFRTLASDTLNAAKPFMRVKKSPMLHIPLFDQTPCPCTCPYHDLATDVWKRLWGRYGTEALALVKNAKSEDLTQIPKTAYLWAELSHEAAQGQVRTLQDLLMRRVRIGLILPFDGQEHFKRIKQLCQPALGWDDHHFEQEIARYREFWQTAHRVPV
ncbi:MAG: FAD-dependent oxidoreductase, partial [Desulfamplus sp.]|nr:FAD-dependent oxidoreductase [Desulfamplus sp.]